MPYFQAVVEYALESSTDNPGGRRLAHIIVNKRPFVTRAEVMTAILADQNYPEADYYAVEAETSHEAIQLVLSGDPEKAQLIRKGPAAT